MRLLPKLLLSFLAVALIGVVVVSVVANHAAASEVRRYMFRGGMTTEGGLVESLAGYYQGRGSWQGVESVLTSGHGMGGMMQQRMILADASGRVVADTSGEPLGQTLPASDLAAGIPVEAEGQLVGTLVAQGGMGGGRGFGPEAQGDVLFRVNRAIWVAAWAAGGASLLLAGLLAFGLVRPIQRLTRATEAVAGGDLAHRVPVDSRDEIGELAGSFNAMADKLEKTEQLRRDMTADLAHELRTPIAVLQSNLEAVIDGVLPPTAENLQPLLDQTQLLTRLVDDLRTLALADAGQLKLNRVPTDPAGLARMVVAQFAPTAEAKNVSLRAEIAGDLPAVSLDPQRIAQVLGNLLNNAIRHTPAGGSVECRVSSDVRSAPWREIPDAQHATRNTQHATPSHPTTRPPDHPTTVTFVVADTGPGIPPEALPHVFERFYRADRSRSRADGGAGLGLAIARQLVEAHGGRIWAASEPGQGTRLTFTLASG
jgi:signal transduction histidine kinase